MEIKPTRFDMTNPFAPMQQRMSQVKTVLRQMPPAQREQLLAEMLPPMPMHRPSSTVEPAVTMVSVKVEAWDGGPVAQQRFPTTILRPRRIVGTIPWQWRWIVAGIRLTRIERNTDWLRRNQALVWEVLARMVRHQLIMGAMNPVDAAAEAKGAKLFAQLIDEIADRFAGQAAPPSDAPTTRKLRSLQCIRTIDR